jgi:predicted DNA-binding transcriptional regulator AlpA
MAQSAINERTVSVAEFCRRSDLSTSTAYRLMESGALARPARVSPGRVGWSASYIDAWLAARLQGEAA